MQKQELFQLRLRVCEICRGNVEPPASETAQGGSEECPDGAEAAGDRFFVPQLPEGKSSCPTVSLWQSLFQDDAALMPSSSKAWMRPKIVDVCHGCR